MLPTGDRDQIDQLLKFRDVNFSRRLIAASSTDLPKRALFGAHCSLSGRHKRQGNFCLQSPLAAISVRDAFQTMSIEWLRLKMAVQL